MIRSALSCAAAATIGAVAWRGDFSAIALTLAVPPLSYMQPTRLAAGSVALGYYAAASWPAYGVVQSFFGDVARASALALARYCWLLSALLAGLITALNSTYPQPEAPRDWASENTTFGDLTNPEQDYFIAQEVQGVAARSNAQVMVFPEAVKVFSGAPAVLDLFAWLSYRCFVAKGAESIPLFREFGLAHQIGTVDYSRPRRFRQMLEEWLTRIRALWPECPARINPDGRSLRIDRAIAVHDSP